MSIHRATLRQREWNEALSAAVLAALLSCCILAGSVLGQESSATDQSGGPAPAQQEPPGDAPEEQESTGPPTTHLLGMSIVEAERGGALVREVDPLGPAAEAGIREGDVLIEVAGGKTDPYGKFLEVVRESVKKRTKGDSIEVVVLRDGKLHELSLTERVGTEERKDDIQRLTEEYSERKDQQQTNQPNEGALLADQLAGGRNGRAAPQNSLGGAGGLAPTYGAGQPQDTDYYFGSGGEFGSALTSAQQNELDRLMRLADRDGLTTAQQQRLDELSALEMSRFEILAPLDNEQREEMRELLDRRRGGDDLNPDDRARLRQLLGRELSRDGALREQREALERLSLQRELNSREQMRLDLLKELGPAAADRVTAESNQGLRDLVGEQFQALTPAQQQRLRTLLQNQQRLTPAEQAELQQLRLRYEGGLARELRNEYQQAQELLQSGQRFTPQQQSRYRLLQRFLGRFSAGVGFDQNALNQPQAPQPANQAGRRGGIEGSGIGLGGPGDPTRPSSGSGIGLGDQGGSPSPNNGSGGSDQ